MKYRFILNPISGKNRNPVLIKKWINEIFSGQNYDVVETKSAKDAIRIAKEAAVEKVNNVIAIGGDGTINEVATGLLNSESALGVVPAGSGNGYARNLNISLDQKEAIRQILNSGTKQADTIRVNNKLTVGVFGVGFDAHIAHLFSKHGTRGAWPYFKISTLEFFKYKAKRYSVIADDFSYEGDAYLIVVAKSSQFGNGATIAPKALLDDGYLDLIVVKPLSIIKAGFFSLRLFNKTLDRSNSVIYRKVKKIEILHKGKIPIHLDGEPLIEKDRLEIEVQLKNLKVLIPNAD